MKKFYLSFAAIILLPAIPFRPAVSAQERSRPNLTRLAKLVISHSAGRVLTPRRIYRDPYIGPLLST